MVNTGASKQAHNENGTAMDNEKMPISRGESSVHIAGVTGSSPVSPTTNSPMKSTDGPEGATVASGSVVPSASRKERAICALYDYGTREGATAASVRRQMKAAGFTAAEIAEAAQEMGGR